jgi:hypothetical protein
MLRPYPKNRTEEKAVRSGSDHRPFGGSPSISFLPCGADDAHSAPSISKEWSANMSDNVEQTTPSSWTEMGGMEQQQESANNWLKEIADAAKAREDSGKEMGHEQGMGR